MILSPLPKLAFLDNNGRPLVGGLLYTYSAGTSSKLATYSNESGTLNTNPVVLDFRGECDLWLDPEQIYKFVLSPKGDTDPPTKPIWSVDDIEAPFGNSNLTRQFLGQRLFPRTQAEIDAGVTPTYYYFPELDAQRYGFAESATSSANVAALQSAMSVANAKANGGMVILPPGAFNCGGASDAIDIPQNCGISGNGMRATRLLSGNDGNNGGLFRVGGVISHVNKYGCSVADLTILLSHNDGIGITLGETIGAYIGRIYIEGPIAASRNSTGIIVDGGDASSFFNLMEDVVCNHIHFGFVVKSTGIDVPTQQTFLQCSVVGDVGIGPDTTSVGLQYAANCGNGSLWLGGNFEACGIGFHPLANCYSTTMMGARFEANTVDVQFESTTGAQNIFSAINLATIVDNSAVNYHRIIAPTTTSNTDATEYNPGVTIKRATVTGQTPMIIEGFPGDTAAEEFLIRNSSGQKLFSVTNQGKFARINNAAPVTVTGSRGGNAALASLLTALADTGIIVDGTTA